MSSKTPNAIHLLHIPLLLNGIVGLTLSSVILIAKHLTGPSWRFPKEQPPLIVFHSVSLTTSLLAILLGRDRLRRFGAVAACKAVLDLLLGIAFFVMHIVQVVKIEDYLWALSERHVVMRMYNANAAFVARLVVPTPARSSLCLSYGAYIGHSFGHFILAIYGLALVISPGAMLRTWEGAYEMLKSWEVWQERSVDGCRHCNEWEQQRVRDPLMGAQYGSLRSGWKGEAGEANEEGQAESDRLIAVDGNEA